ncbi:MAG: hypothetical protein P8172_15835 [Gammaproteobacteria bacterium]
MILSRAIAVASVISLLLPSARASEEEEEAPLLDRAQQRVHGVVSGSAAYFDSFFGETDLDEGSNVSRGSLSVAGQWDERDGFEERVRLHARIAMPALKDRTRITFGRGDAEDFIDGTVMDDVDTLPERFKDFQDDEWLFGVGYSRNQHFARGWDFSLGVKLRTPLEPYARATYRWNRTYDDAWLWRLRPRIFVQSQRGLGASLNNTVDHALNDNWLLRSGTTLQAEDDIEGLRWSQQFTGYQSLSNKTSVSYAVFGTGETGAEVPVRDYGVEVRYRRRIAREWLFVELLSYLSWPREFRFEERQSNLGVGVEFEMQFGRWPGRESGDNR